MPVYPKESSEYRQKILKSFYKQVQETNWGVPEERICKRRGRKPQERIVVERPLRPKVEYKSTKFFNFN
jgi:hypothetical protein